MKPLRRWFADRRRSRVPRAPATLAPGQRLYCIGDIHGCANLLRALHVQIAADAEGYEGELQLVYLGDYIDRGEHSKEVIDLLLSEPLEGFDTITLRGNHEQALLDFLEHPERAQAWLGFGGLATLLSYGVRLRHAPFAAELPELALELRDRLPQDHLEFFKRLPLQHVAGGYWFVHAGIRPGLALERQHPDDLLWIREEFLSHPGPHDAVVVHGHSITEEVELFEHRIGLDTGAYYSGVLSCLVLEGSERRLLQTTP